MADEETRGEREEIEAAVDSTMETFKAAFQATLASYVAHPGDDAGAVRAVVSETGWPQTQAERLIEQTREELGRLAAVAREGLQEEARAVGVDIQQVAGLKAVKAKRSADLNTRIAALFKELRGLVPDNKTVGESVTPEELERLALKHGLTIGPDGQPALAEDAG